MALTVELDDTILLALRGSDTYFLPKYPGSYVAVQNPWKQPVELRNGERVLHLAHDSWLVAPANVTNPSLVSSYTPQQWTDLRAGREPNLTIAENININSFTAPPSPYMNTEPASPGYGLAIGALVTSFFASLIGLILGIVALNTIRKNNGRGRGIAVAAIAVSSVFTFFGSLMVLSGIASLSNFENSGSKYSYVEPTVVPRWWDASNEKILGILNNVQPGFKLLEKDDECSYELVIASYSNTPDEPIEDLNALATEYLTILGEHYPDNRATLSVETDIADNKFYTVSVSSWSSKNSEENIPAVYITVKRDSTMATLNAVCLDESTDR